MGMELGMLNLLLSYSLKASNKRVKALIVLPWQTISNLLLSTNYGLI